MANLGLMSKFIKRLSEIYWSKIASPIRYARHLGVTIGENTLISTRNWSNEAYLVTIGNHVRITDNVSIHTHGGAGCVRKEHPDFDAFGRVIIEDWAYIGSHAQIMPGVTVGEGALVAAGSVVTKSVAPHTVVGGNPARFICTTEEYYEKNKQFNVGTNGLNINEKKKVLLSLPDEKFVK